LAHASKAPFALQELSHFFILEVRYSLRDFGFYQESDYFPTLVRLTLSPKLSPLAVIHLHEESRQLLMTTAIDL
jgi:hypothetical protein